MQPISVCWVRGFTWVHGEMDEALGVDTFEVSFEL